MPESLSSLRNYELHPPESEERLAIVLQMADGISRTDQDAFPLLYKVDQKFVQKARSIWERGTALTGKEVQTYLFSANGKLDLGNTWDTGTFVSVSLRRGSPVDRMQSIKVFPNGGRVIGLAHTHPDTQEYYPDDEKKVIRFSRGDFISFIQDNIQKSKNNMRVVVEMTIEPDGLGLMIATQDTFKKIEQESKKNNEINRKNQLIRRLRHLFQGTTRVSRHDPLNYRQAKKWGMVIYHYKFGSQCWQKIM